MSAEQFKWFQDLASEVSADDFDNVGMPDKMAVWIEMDGKKLKYWVGKLTMFQTQASSATSPVKKTGLLPW